MMLSGAPIQENIEISNNDIIIDEGSKNNAQTTS